MSLDLNLCPYNDDVGVALTARSSLWPLKSVSSTAIGDPEVSWQPPRWGLISTTNIIASAINKLISMLLEAERRIYAIVGSDNGLSSGRREAII